MTYDDLELSNRYSQDYFAKLQHDDFLKVPEHMISADDMVVLHVPGDVDESGKHGSLTVVFSVWNAMVGTGLLTLPWAFGQGGIIYSFLLTLLAFLLSFMTQYFTMAASHQEDTDFTMTLRRHFGPKGELVASMIYISMLSLPVIIYIQLLAQNLYPILVFVRSQFFPELDMTLDFSVDFEGLTYSNTCFILLAMMLVLCQGKDLGGFVKLNTLGCIFTVVILVFICHYGVRTLLSGDLVWAQDLQTEVPHELKLYGPNANCLIGILTGGFYLHNISIPIIKNAKNPENNYRDVLCGFLLVFISYGFCGTLGYIGFSNEELFPQREIA